MAMGDELSEEDLADPNPDLEDLFRHYDRLYFRGALAEAGFVVKWGSSLTSSSFGSCTFSKPRNTITLFEPVLKYLSCTDRKNALLHEMIHAIIYVKHQKTASSNHGPLFRAWMDAINSCSIKDYQRPDGGYNITTRHDFSPEEPHSFKGILWKCDSCGDTHLRAKNQGPPSDACCIENVNSASCGNMLCHWHNHKNGCGGTYKKTMLESDAPSQKKVPGGAQLLLTYPLEMSKSKEAIQECSSSALQRKTRTTKPNAEDKHLSLVSSSDGTPHGSSSSKKTGKRRRPEAVTERSIVLAVTPRKAKEEQGVAAEDDLFSLIRGTSAKSPRSQSKKVFKAAKEHKPEDVQKPSGLPALPQGKQNQNHGLVATDKEEFLSVEGYNNAPSSGSDASKKVGKRHKRAYVQKPSVEPSAPLGTPKLQHALVATQKDKLSSAKVCDDAKSGRRNTSKKAGEQHEPQITHKACSQLAYSQERLKQDMVAPEKKELSPAMCCSNEKLLDKSSSKKAHRQHESEGFRKTIDLPAAPGSKPKASGFRKTTVLPAAPGSKPKASGVIASEKRRKGKCKTAIARGKEYVVMSLWLDYYESDRSSGSTEPLVNKRTERRRREIEGANARIQTYSRSKKINPAPFVYSRTDAPISSHRIKVEPMEQYRPTTTANQVVVTPATGGDHSQPSAPWLDIVPLQPAGPPSLTPNQSTTLDIIDISDDD